MRIQTANIKNESNYRNAVINYGGCSVEVVMKSLLKELDSRLSIELGTYNTYECRRFILSKINSLGVEYPYKAIHEYDSYMGNYLPYDNETEIREYKKLLEDIILDDEYEDDDNKYGTVLAVFDELDNGTVSYAAPDASLYVDSSYSIDTTSTGYAIFIYLLEAYIEYMTDISMEVAHSIIGSKNEYIKAVALGLIQMSEDYDRNLSSSDDMAKLIGSEEKYNKFRNSVEEYVYSIEDEYSYCDIDLATLILIYTYRFYGVM